MVATKKSQTKKSTVTKSVSRRSPAKKTSKKATPRPLTWRFYAVAIGIFTIVVGAVMVLALLMTNVAQTKKSLIERERTDKISKIYGSLALGDDYSLVGKNIFGEIRYYGDDRNRTQSSSAKYIHGDTVASTVTKLDTKIKAAGFSFTGQPSADRQATEYHYKSANGEYLRLIVSSKLHDDARYNASVMGQDAESAVAAIDPNAGPSNILIKVNLDDNNE